ncbi:MAG: hypothetical protein F6K47_23725 [Symploca sp. SIO2E6]|nr:hypothetical protein [Symploca sp. SIO2E6]
MIKIPKKLLFLPQDVANILVLFLTVLMVLGIALDFIILPPPRRYNLKPITKDDMREVCSKPEEFMADLDYQAFERDRDENKLEFTIIEEYTVNGKTMEIFDVNLIREELDKNNPIIPAFRWTCQYFHGLGADKENKNYGLNFDKFCLRRGGGNAVPVVHHPRKTKIYCTPRPVR